MPRSAGFQTSVAELVFQQLQGTPDEDRSREMIRACENLLGEIDPDGSYPAEFVLWRLTDERNTDDPTSILGRQLRADLAVLIQRCSEQAPTRLDDHPDGITDLHEAAASMGVSVRTIQRWRREGLVLRHVLFGDGPARLGILASDLKDFRNRSGDRIARAAGFSRMDPVEEAELIDRARALMAQGCSLNQAAREVARGSRRAHETIRQLIRRHRGERGPVTGVGGRVSDRERSLVLGAIDRGVDAPSIATRIGRSPASTRRIAAEARAARLRGVRPRWIEMPAFEQTDAEHVLLAPVTSWRVRQPPDWNTPATCLPR